jgi:hypothetical protein
MGIRVVLDECAYELIWQGSIWKRQCDRIKQLGASRLADDQPVGIAHRISSSFSLCDCRSSSFSYFHTLEMKQPPPPPPTLPDGNEDPPSPMGVPLSFDSSALKRAASLDGALSNPSVL